MQHKRRCLTLLLAVLATPVLPGCGGTNYACGDFVSPYGAITVRVYDAKTGQPAAQGATATLNDGKLLETMKPITDSTGAQVGFTGGHGTGAYTVEVDKTGYAVWTRTGVNVTQGPCDLNSIALRADLQPTQ
jgi:hypothetical protein